jgi:hypothetical protein
MLILGTQFKFEEAEIVFWKNLPLSLHNVPSYFNTVLYHWIQRRFLCLTQSEKA